MKGMNSVQNLSEILQLARKFNCFYLSGLHSGTCKPFIVAGHQVGLIRPEILKYLMKFPEIFTITGKYVELNPAFRDYRERTTKIADMLQTLRKESDLVALKGWRDECFEVSTPMFPEALMEMERSALCLFGIRNYGVSVTGYIQHPTKGLCIWLQQRSATKQTWPGKWDCFVSGGLAVGYGILETTIKEAAEEASVSRDLANSLVPAGCVSFFFESERGLFPNTEYVYDLELPVNFKPVNADGEVQAFELLSAADCISRALSPQFKTTSAPVLLDFLIRKGYINPENESNYRYLVELLHVPLQSVYSWPYTMTLTTPITNGEVPELVP